MGSTCLSCGEGAVVADPDSGALVCTSCGVIQDAGGAEFVHQSTFNDSGGLDLRVSSLVRNSSDSAYRDQKLAVASAGITSTATRLGLSRARAEEALRMAKSSTDGQLATPGSAFLPALAAACTLLVARSHHLPLSLAEAAEAAFCSGLRASAGIGGRRSWDKAERLPNRRIDRAGRIATRMGFFFQSDVRSPPTASPAGGRSA